MRFNVAAWVEGNAINGIDPTGRACQINSVSSNVSLLQDDGCEDNACGTYAWPIPSDGNNLPTEFLNEQRKMCQEFCNPESDKYILDQLRGPCRTAAEQICDSLCNNEPRADNDDCNHKGLMRRWMEYFIDRHDARATHGFCYGEVQRELASLFDRSLPNYINDGWLGGFNQCHRISAATQEFDEIAQRWSEKALQPGPSEVQITDLPVNPVPTPDTDFCGGFNILLCIPVAFPNLIPRGGMFFPFGAPLGGPNYVR